MPRMNDWRDLGEMAQTPTLGSQGKALSVLSGLPRLSASDPLEADVVDIRIIMRRSYGALYNQQLTGMKKRDVLKNKETTVIDPCFGGSSQNGMKTGHIFPFNAKNGAKTAPRIPYSI